MSDPTDQSDAPRARARADAAPAASVDAATPAATQAATPALASAAAPAPAILRAAPHRRRRLALRRVAFAAIALAAIGYGGWTGLDWLVNGRFVVSTDDAYVKADMTVVSAKVSGYVAAVEAQDNAHVAAGTVLVRIEDGDYRLAVKAATDRLATQDATIARIGEQGEAQRALVAQATAQLAAAKADGARAAAAFARVQNLSRHEVASRAQYDAALADRDRANAAVEAARAAVTAAEQGGAVLDAQREEARRQRAELETAKERAERDLSFTTVAAPVEGFVGNKAARVGQLVQPGQRLLALVPLDEVYVEANFKETQIVALHPGQKVDIEVDALSGRSIEGEIASLAPASGAQFSLLPPDNATGNFTKIVQRVPVRIAVPADVAREGALRPGLSVVASVRTRPRRDLASALNVTAIADALRAGAR